MFIIVMTWIQLIYGITPVITSIYSFLHGCECIDEDEKVVVTCPRYPVDFLLLT